ncbi:hypothetical protein HDU98_008996 [Podochytrium sp. JEL0797]|nr:hypothetical protein HDU98_008996 [Podochytrium sp. JEL0797]
MSDIEMDEAEDPIVQEIPVFLSHQLLASAGLVLVQYPSTKRQQPLPNTATMRCKPVAQRFEVELKVDQFGSNFNEDQAEKLARGMDNEEIATAYDIDHRNNPYKEESKKLLDKMTLTSTLLPDTTGGQYLIGALRDDEFHLTPISAAIQLRPALKYLDKILEKEKAATAKIQQHELNLEQPNRKQEELVEKGVTMSMRTVEDNPEALRKQREVEMEKRFANEKWVDLKVFDDNSPESEEAYEKLFSLGDELTFSFSKQDYLENIGPKLSASVKNEIDQGKRNIKPNWSLDDIRNLPLPSLLRSLLIYAPVVSFSTLMELTENMFEESDMIEELERIAVLVHGVWVVRSEIIYSGRAADARRILLQLLARSSKPVSRHDVNRIAKLPHTVITSIFIEICARVQVIREANSGHHVDGGKVLPGSETVSKWGLKVAADLEFEEKWEEVVERQGRVVEEEGERARRNLEKPGSGKAGHATAVHAPASKASARATSAAPAASSSSTAASSSESKPAAKATGRGARGEARAPTASVDSFSVKGATPRDQIENLLYFALNKYCVCSIEYLQDLVDRHKTALAAEGSENLLDSDEVTPDLVLQVVGEVCVTVQDRWVLKTVGGAVDEFRDPVIELFRGKQVVKKGDVQAACQTATGKNIAQSMYARVMKELAVSSGPSWELKKSPVV